MVRYLYKPYQESIVMNTFSNNPILSVVRENAGTGVLDVVEIFIDGMLDLNLEAGHLTLSATASIGNKGRPFL